MKFPRFYNPFRRIRELETDLHQEEQYSDAMTSAYNSKARKLFSTTKDLEATRALLANANILLESAAQELEAQDHALEAHMDERADLKLTIAGQNLAGTYLVHELRTFEAALEVAASEIAGMEQVQADAVAYVKTVEAELGAGGIAIRDTEDGPVIVVNQDLFLQRVTEGAFKIEREETSGPRPTAVAA